jgi:hypothetical protein
MELVAMTFTLLEVLAGIACVAVVVGAVSFTRLARRLTGTAREIEYAARRVAALAPAVQSLIDDGHAELEELRSLTRKTSEIAGDVRAVTGEASVATANLVRALEGRIVDRYAAIVAGARAGLDILRHARSSNGSNTMEQEIDALADR